MIELRGRWIRNFVAVALVFLCSFAKAQTCTIEGTLPGAQGREIVLTTVTNHLSEKQEVVQRQKIADDGTFFFSFDVSRIMPVTLSVNFYTTTFFVSPNGKYVLSGKGFYFDDYVNPFIAQPMLPLYLVNTDLLNRFVIRFNRNMQAVEAANYQNILTRQDFTLLDELYMSVDTLPEGIRAFCHDYQYYTIGSLKASYSKKRSPKLATTYLASRAPDAYDYNYMLFFNAFFSEYLPNHGYNISMQELVNAINKQQSLSGALAVLGNDPTLKEPSLRQMYLVKLLREGRFSRQASAKILSALQSESPFVAVREAAGQGREALLYLSQGSVAPMFSLPDASGNIVDSESLKGKYIYVNFFKTNCIDCLAEMETMRELYSRNNAFFEFVSICINDKENAFSVFNDSHKYPWKVLYAGYHQDFIMQWQAKTLPYYILIGSNNKVMECPATTPDQVNHLMERISWEERRKQRRTDSGQ